MLYSLSTQVIADTVHALVALELLSAPPQTTVILSPLLDPAKRGLLTLMIKNAFAETVVGLLPYVDDAGLDDEKASSAPDPHQADDCQDHLLQVSLRVASPSAGIHGIIRRHLEMAVVLRVIHTALTAGGSSVVGNSVQAIEQKLRTYLEALVSALRSPGDPFVRPRFF